MVNNLFRRWEYDYIPQTSTKEEYVKRIGKLANVANKRAKTLTTAIAKGRIDEENTALFRYQQALKYLANATGKQRSYLTTGKTLYNQLSITKLKALETKILHYLEAESSTARGAIEIRQRANETFKERWGLDLTKVSKDESSKMFSLLHKLTSEIDKSMLGSGQIVTQLVEAVKTKDVKGLEAVINEFDDMYQHVPIKERRKTELALLRASGLQIDYKTGMRIIHNARETYNPVATEV